MIEMVMALFSSDDADDFQGMSRRAKAVLAVGVILAAGAGAVVWFLVAAR